MAEMTSAARTTSRGSKRERRAWYMFDLGNSAYAAVILLAVYSAYFKGQVVGGAEGTRLWGLSVGIAMLVVALVSPVLGAIADFSASKKLMLGALTALSVTCTALLVLVGPGDALLGMVLFILAEIGYRGAQVFYNAILPEIADPDEMGKVSGIGWAIGSAGGILCLLIILPLIMFVKGTMMIRFSFVITAAFYGLATLPLFFRFRERGKPQRLPAGENYMSVGFHRLAATFRKARQFKHFLRYMLAFLVYNDGIIIALDFAAILGAVLYGMDQQQLIILMILVQVTSVIGAYVFGLLAEKASCKRSILASLGVMIVVVFWLYVSHSAAMFYVIAGLAGFALTGVQSVSRAMVGVLSPQGQSAEFYGFFASTGQASSFIGPTLYGWLALTAAKSYEARGLAALAAEQEGQRLAVLAIAAFLVVGLVLLLLIVNERKGREAALAASMVAVPLSELQPALAETAEK